MRTWLAGAVLWLGAASTAAAQERIRLGAVLDSLESHPMVVAARAGVRASEARIGPAGGWPDPRIQLGLMGRQLPGLGLQSPLGMTTLQLTQMVPVAGQSGMAARSARAAAAAARERVEATRWELRTRAAMLFYDVYLAQEGLSLALASREAMAQVVAAAQAMYAAGQGRQAEVLRAQVELGRMDEEVVRMRSMREGMAGRLNALLRRPLEAPFGDVARPELPAALPPLDSLARMALAGRPLLRAGRQELEAATAGAGRARRERWPDLEIGVQYGQRPMEDGGTDRMLSLMLGASVPIRPGSRQRQMALEASAMRDETAAELAVQEGETLEQLAEWHATFGRAGRLTDLHRRSVIPQAEAGAASALAAYREGTGDLAGVLEAQLAVTGYRSALLEWEVEQGKAVAELEMLIAAMLLDPHTAAARPGRTP